MRLPGTDFPERVGLQIAKWMRVFEEAVACAILLMRVSVGQ